MICNNCNNDGGNGRFCSQCGEPMGKKVQCPNCKTLTAHAFCPHCGNQLDMSYTDKRLCLLHIYGSTLVTCDTSVTTLVVPDCVRKIDEYAFGNCAWLEKIVITNNVKSIGDFAFARCRWLEEVTIPNSVTHLGEGIFSKCEKLENIHFDGTKAQ